MPKMSKKAKELHGFGRGGPGSLLQGEKPETPKPGARAMMPPTVPGVVYVDQDAALTAYYLIRRFQANADVLSFQYAAELESARRNLFRAFPPSIQNRLGKEESEEG